MDRWTVGEWTVVRNAVWDAVMESWKQASHCYEIGLPETAKFWVQRVVDLKSGYDRLDAVEVVFIGRGF